MAVYVEFVEVRQPDNPIFGFDLEALPRVGDIISFSFHPIDKDNWDKDSVAELEKSNNQSFTVLTVEHFLQIRSLKSRVHQVICTVRRTGTDGKGDASDGV